MKPRELPHERSCIWALQRPHPALIISILSSWSLYCDRAKSSSPIFVLPRLDPVGFSDSAKAQCRPSGGASPKAAYFDLPSSMYMRLEESSLRERGQRSIVVEAVLPHRLADFRPKFRSLRRGVAQPLCASGGTDAGMALHAQQQCFESPLCPPRFASVFEGYPEPNILSVTFACCRCRKHPAELR